MSVGSKKLIPSGTRCVMYKALTFHTSTRPKPVGHGYALSMAVGTIGEWFGSFLKIDILAVKHLKKIFWPGPLGK